MPDKQVFSDMAGHSPLTQQRDAWDGSRSRALCWRRMFCEKPPLTPLRKNGMSWSRAAASVPAALTHSQPFARLMRPPGSERSFTLHSPVSGALNGGPESDTDWYHILVHSYRRSQPYIETTQNRSFARPSPLPNFRHSFISALNALGA